MVSSASDDSDVEVVRKKPKLVNSHAGSLKNGPYSLGSGRNQESKARGKPLALVEKPNRLIVGQTSEEEDEEDSDQVQQIHSHKNGVQMNETASQSPKSKKRARRLSSNSEHSSEGVEVARSRRSLARKPTYTERKNSSESDSESESPQNNNTANNRKSTARPSRKPMHREQKTCSESESESVSVPNNVTANRRSTGRPSRKPIHREKESSSEVESEDESILNLKSRRTANKKPVYKEKDSNSSLSEGESPEPKPRSRKSIARPSQKSTHKETKRLSDTGSSDDIAIVPAQQKATGRPSRKPMLKETKKLSESEASDDSAFVPTQRKVTARPSEKPVHKDRKRFSGSGSRSSDSDGDGKNNARSRRTNGQKPDYKDDNGNSSGSDFDPRQKASANAWTSTRPRRQGISYKDAASDGNNDEESSEESSSHSSDDSSGRERRKRKKNKRTGKKKGYQRQKRPQYQGPRVSMVLNRRMGKVGATGPGTTKYNADKSGDPNVNLPDDTELEAQYLINWVNESHLHNTWESFKTIEKLGDKFSLNRILKYEAAEDEFEIWCKRADPDDAEYAKCEREMQRDLLSCYSRAERIIDRDVIANGKLEYFVKWEGLPYSEATWEAGDLIKKYFRPVIEIYDKLRRASTIPENSKFDNSKQRPRFVHEKVQPDYMKGGAQDLVLRDYQLDSINWLINSWCKRNSVILGDEMGLGKTIQAICFLQYLFKTHSIYGPFLIVVPLSTISAWIKEFALWAPGMNVVTLIGSQDSRAIIKDKEFYGDWRRHFKFNVLLTSYEMVVKEFRELSSKTWQVLIVDEAHRLKNQKSEWHKYLANYKSNHRILMTGTPIQNSLQELWSLLHFIMPKQFPSWEEFEKEHEGAASDGYKKLHSQLEPFLIRRVKKDVEKSLPIKREKILRVAMTPTQREVYKHILSRNYNALKREANGNRTTFMNMMMQLRKCCNHEMLITKETANGVSGVQESIEQLLKGSAKLMLLDKLLVRLKSMGHRVLIFSQFVMMLDVIEELMELRHFVHQRLDGNTSNDLRQQALKRFNDPDSKDFCFLLSTRAGGLGLNLTAANTVIIFDSDWNPQNDLQAQARAHRIGQTRQVNVYKIITKNSVEETIIERAKQKLVLDHLVIQRMDTTGRQAVSPSKRKSNANVAENDFTKEELNTILKFGAEELFKDNTKSDDYVCDIDEILRQADEEEPLPDTERPGNELLSAFKVISFANDEKDWDEIIPEDIRAKVQAEERDRELTAVLSLDRRSRHARLQERLRKKKSPKKPVAGKRVRARTPSDEEAGPSPKSAHEEDDVFEVSSGLSDSDSDSELSDDADLAFAKRFKDAKDPKEPKGHHPKLYGLTQGEVRNFVRYFTKFPKPMSRLEDIARVADLSGKDMEPLQKLGKLLLTAVSSTMVAAEKYKERIQRERVLYRQQMEQARMKEGAKMAQEVINNVINAINRTGQEEPEVVTLDDNDATTEPEPISLSPSSSTSAPAATLGPGVAPPIQHPVLPTPPSYPTWINPYNFNFDAFPKYKLNARTLSSELSFLEPLGFIVPTDDQVRRSWTFNCPVTGANYDVKWDNNDDTQLLLGVWKHGFIGWVELREKVLVLRQKLQSPSSDKSPRPVEINQRFTYLLQVARKFVTLATARNISLQQAIADSMRPPPPPPRPVPIQPAPVPAQLVTNPFMVVLPPNDLTKHFSPWEVRRFMAALEEFPNPFSRMKEVSSFAMITKPLHLLVKLGHYILEKCREQEAKNKLTDSTQINPNVKIVKPVSICICGTPIHFSLFLSRMEKMMALDELIPSTQNARRNWVFPYPLKAPPSYSVEWGQQEDTRLLLAVWESGMSNVETVCKGNPLLQTKIFLQTSGKQPTFVTVMNRVRALLTLIHKKGGRASLPKKKVTKTAAAVSLVVASTSNFNAKPRPPITVGSRSQPQFQPKPMQHPIPAKNMKLNGHLEGFVNPGPETGTRRRMTITNFLKLHPKLTKAHVILHRLDPQPVRVPVRVVPKIEPRILKSPNQKPSPPKPRVTKPTQEEVLIDLTLDD